MDFPKGDNGVGMIADAMLSAIFMFVISLGAIVAGRGYVKTSHRMRAFRTTRARIVERKLAVVSSTEESRWGGGGGYQPMPAYVYTVDGVEYRSDRASYALKGSAKHLAEEELAAIPDEIDVHYDPASPDVVYRELHTPSASCSRCCSLWLSGPPAAAGPARRLRRASRAGRCQARRRAAPIRPPGGRGRAAPRR
jgi:hypothetical protein